MHLTYEQTLALIPALAHEHPDAPGQRRAERQRLPTTNAVGQNKTEAAWSRHLADLKANGSIRDYWWEPIKLRLAGNTSYRPDFLVWRLDGTIAICEIKGFMREDSAAKIKMCPEKFPWLEFFVVFRKRQTWDVRSVGYNGIGRRNIGDAWMKGTEL
jgi:uncharacterized protein DUF1064